MLLNPTNVVFCGLSTAQLLLLSTFLPRTLYSFYIDAECSYHTKTYWLLLLLWIDVNVTLVTHTIAVAHVVGEGAITRAVSAHKCSRAGDTGYDSLPHHPLRRQAAGDVRDGEARLHSHLHLCATHVHQVRVSVESCTGRVSRAPRLAASISTR